MKTGKYLLNFCVLALLLCAVSRLGDTKKMKKLARKTIPLR